MASFIIELSTKYFHFKAKGYQHETRLSMPQNPNICAVLENSQNIVFISWIVCRSIWFGIILNLLCRDIIFSSCKVLCTIEKIFVDENKLSVSLQNRWNNGQHSRQIYSKHTNSTNSLEARDLGLKQTKNSKLDK